MILVNTFEEPFGDIHGKGGNKHDKGVWTKLGGKAFSRINRSVVALASFNGDFIVTCHFCLMSVFDHNYSLHPKL
jgi:hypothetical protein